MLLIIEDEKSFINFYILVIITSMFFTGIIDSLDISKKFKKTSIIIAINYSKISLLEFVNKMIWLSGAEAPY